MRVFERIIGKSFLRIIWVVLKITAIVVFASRNIEFVYKGF